MIEHIFLCFIKISNQFNNNAGLAIAGAVKGTSKEKVYQELGFESLQQRRWYWKLCCLFKIIKNKLSSYLFQLFLSSTSRYLTRNSNISQIRTKHNFFKNFFFPSTINEWNNLDPDICNSESVVVFKSRILKFMWPKPNNIYNCHNAKGIRLITRLRLGLSHLRKHKFKHSFHDCLHPLLRNCPTYLYKRMTFLNKIRNINYGILKLSNTIMTKTLLFDDSLLGDSGYTNTNWYYPPVEKFCVYLLAKNQLHPSSFWGDNAKILKTSYFG